MEAAGLGVHGGGVSAARPAGPPPAHVHVRPLRADDAAEYWQLRLEALENEPLAFGGHADDHRRTSVADAAARIAETDESVVLGAFVLGRLRGMTGLRRAAGIKVRHRASVWGVYVAPELRGRGVGRRLTEAAIARARAMDGVERVTLSVSLAMPAARGLYHALGFEPYGLERAALKVGGEYVDEEHLVLVL